MLLFSLPGTLSTFSPPLPWRPLTHHLKQPEHHRLQEAFVARPLPPLGFHSILRPPVSWHTSHTKIVLLCTCLLCWGRCLFWFLQCPLPPLIIASSLPHFEEMTFPLHLHSCGSDRASNYSVAQAKPIRALPWDFLSMNAGWENASLSSGIKIFINLELCLAVPHSPPTMKDIHLQGTEWILHSEETPTKG